MNGSDAMRAALFAQKRILLLDRSAEFERALQIPLEQIEFVMPPGNNRLRLCEAALLLSIEHARVLRLALDSEAPSSATALFRLQFEALVRAAWIFFVAQEAQMSKLMQPISEQAEQEANELPLLRDMLGVLKVRGPAGLMNPLLAVNDNIRNPLNSYVHGGLHPLRRRLAGFPTDLVFEVLFRSNELLHHAYRIMALMRNSQLLMDQVTDLHLHFRDCLSDQDAVS